MNNLRLPFLQRFVQRNRERPRLRVRTRSRFDESLDFNFRARWDIDSLILGIKLMMKTKGEFKKKYSRLESGTIEDLMAQKQTMGEGSGKMLIRKCLDAWKVTKGSNG